MSVSIPQKMPYVFQPIFDVRNNDLKIYGREALIRPLDCTPGEFINKMVKDGKTHELEYITFYNAVEQFQNRGYKEKLFLNSFPYETLSIDEMGAVKSLCMEKPSSDIVIEFLEYGNDFREHRTMKKVHDLKRRRYKIALDDFGTGFNSVNALKTMQPNIVKIDRHYIDECLISDIGKNTLEIIVNYLKNNNVTVLAEGVETKSQFELCRKIGIDYMQGYYLGYPE